MSVVVVTGASGFVGRHAVSALLERGFVVHAVGRHEISELPVYWHNIDLLDGTARRTLLRSVRPTHLLHFAWETAHGYFWEAPENLDWVSLTLDLVRVFQACGGERATFSGSCAEYDWTHDALEDGVCREYQTPRRPATLYGLAKFVTFELISSFAARSGLSCSWGRIFFLYGPYEKSTRLVPSVIRALLADQSIALGDGALVRDFIDTRDAGAAFAALLASSVEGPVNIASGKGVTIAELVHELARLVEDRERLLGFGKRPSPVGEPRRLIADVSRMRSELNFSPRYDLPRGLADAVSWWRTKTTAQSSEAMPWLR